MNRAPWLFGALLFGAVAVSALVAGGGTEGTVVAKSGQADYDYACQAGGTVLSPVAVPAWGSCSSPECWRLVVRDNGGHTSEPCVSQEEYDRTRVGGFWRGRTDR